MVPVTFRSVRSGEGYKRILMVPPLRIELSCSVLQTDAITILAQAAYKQITGDCDYLHHWHDVFVYLIWDSNPCFGLHDRVLSTELIRT